jgi:hypothetical protein
LIETKVGYSNKVRQALSAEKAVFDQGRQAQMKKRQKYQSQI